MNTLYDDLLARTVLPNAYDDWAAYRTALTDFVIAHTVMDSHLLLVGAGACNDFDLGRLLSHTKNLTLLDRDAVAMRRGMARQGLPDDACMLTACDLLGVSDAAYRAFSDRMLHTARDVLGKGLPAERFADRFVAELNQLLDSAAADPLPDADAIVCCGVHSQLLSMFVRMANVFSRYVSFDPAPVHAAVRAHNARLMPRLNDALFAAAPFVCFGLETERVGVIGGIDGAAEALADLFSRHLPILSETSLLWPLDPSQGKTYTVRAVWMGEK